MKTNINDKVPCFVKMGENKMVTTKMEELVKEMQGMFKKGKSDAEGDKYLFFSPKYNPKVKVSEW